MKPRELGALILLAAIWGASYLFIRIAAPVLGPSRLMGARVVIAGAVMLVALAARGQLPRIGGVWRQFLFLGAFNAAIPFTLIAIATLHSTASWSVILIATAPLFTGLIATVWDKERLTQRKLSGLLLGIVGVVVLVGWNPITLNASLLLAAGLLLLASFCYAIGNVYARRSSIGLTPMQLNAGQQVGAAVVLVLPALFAPSPQAPTTEAVGALLALALLCTAFAYMLYFYLITQVGATRTSVVSFLVPFFGILWGVVFLHEPVSANMFIALALILVSVALVSGVDFTRLVQRQPATS